MALEEKFFKINLRKDWVKKPRVARANRSVDYIRSFVSKHMKVDEVKITQLLNESLWVNGAKKPPAHLAFKVVKDDKGVVTAMLPEEKMEVTEKKGLKHKLLRQKGETETKLVMGDKKQEIAIGDKHEAKPAEEKKDAKSEIKTDIHQKTEAPHTSEKK